MEEKYVNTTELLHRISKLRTSRDDFPDETYCKEHERILTARIEESNNMLDQTVDIIHRMSKEEDFIVVKRGSRIMQKVVMFTKDQSFGYTVDYQLTEYLERNPDVSVRCVSLDHDENHRDRLIVVFDIKEEN